MSILRELFTWWNGQTIGTRLFTARRGVFVGDDTAGNRYYHTRDGKRRWVIFNGSAEASAVSADWHGWLHHTYDAPPTEAPLPRQAWEKDHRPNATGGPDAYRPQGSLSAAGARPVVVGDYQSWSPE